VGRGSIWKRSIGARAICLYPARSEGRTLADELPPVCETGGGRDGSCRCACLHSGGGSACRHRRDRCVQPLAEAHDRGRGACVAAAELTVWSCTVIAAEHRAELNGQTLSRLGRGPEPSGALMGLQLGRCAAADAALPNGATDLDDRSRSVEPTTLRISASVTGTPTAALGSPGFRDVGATVRQPRRLAVLLASTAGLSAAYVDAFAAALAPFGVPVRGGRGCRPGCHWCRWRPWRGRRHHVPPDHLLASGCPRCGRAPPPPPAGRALTRAAGAAEVAGDDVAAPPCGSSRAGGDDSLRKSGGCGTFGPAAEPSDYADSNERCTAVIAAA